MGIGYALLSMLFAGVNDFIFKQYISAHPRRGLGLFMAGVGLVWTGLCGAGMAITHAPLRLDSWPIVLGAGACSFVANVLFINSFRVYPAGTGATIYRLNLVLVAVLSFLWLREAVTAWKVAGIVLGVVAVVALGRADATVETRAKATVTGALMLAAACVCRALMGILYKLASTYGIPQFTLLAVNGLCWLLGGLLLVALARDPWRPDARLLRFAAASGLLVVGIVYGMFAATRHADASIAIPITQMSFLVTSVLGVMLHGEQWSWPRLGMLAAAIGSIVSLSRG